LETGRPNYNRPQDDGTFAAGLAYLKNLQSFKLLLFEMRKFVVQPVAEALQQLNQLRSLRIFHHQVPNNKRIDDVPSF
jgi:hypothetical protein